LKEVVSKLERAVRGVEDVYYGLVDVLFTGDDRDMSLLAVFVKVEDALRLLDDAITIVKSIRREQPSSVQERFKRGIEKALEG
jgi:hypothetical protein